MVTLSLIKEARIYNGEKTASSINGPGKTGQLHVKNEIRTKNCTVCMEVQKALNSQSNLEKEKWSWRNQAPGLQTILQSYSSQDSTGLAQKQKYRSMENRRESPEINPCTYGHLIFDK